jgi:hypothetical protein
MSNMYGYSDYTGPDMFRDSFAQAKGDLTSTYAADCQGSSEIDSDDLENNPLQVGFWMEGDSLAPPCGSGIPTIHSMLEFAAVSVEDVLYDLGCGDGRVCIEAFALYKCVSIGVEIENDLVDRANCLISSLPKSQDMAPRILKQDLRNVLQSLVAISKQAGRAKNEVSGISPLPLPTVMMLYLLPDALKEIEDNLIVLLTKLPTEFRIVCNTWGLTSLKPVKTDSFREESGSVTQALLYTKQSLTCDS